MTLKSLSNLALFHFRQGNIEKYRSYAERVDDLGLSPEEALAPGNLGQLSKLRRHDILVRAFEQGDQVWRGNGEYVYLYGESLLRLGRVADGARAWSDLIASGKAEPFVATRLGQLLRHPEAVLGHRLLIEPEPEVHILILTKDRREYLRHTLACLRKTDYTNYKVYIVDNNSTDGTPETIEQEAAAFPPHVEVHHQALPTNIGRPGGHNWLLTAFDHSRAAYISILDDDLLDFPPNWLKAYLNTLALGPDIGAVGGKTVGADFLIQDATSIITKVTEENGIEFFTNRNADDWGQFDYISNVSDYIIGCACIYKKEIFDTVGLFDIRFSPSQGVDIDHGIRMRKKGYDLMYNGNITFVHAQLTSEGILTDRARLGNSKGNFLKLGYKYTPEEYASLIADRIERERRFRETFGAY